MPIHPKTYAFAGNILTILVPGDQTNGRFAVLLTTKPAGNSTPPHVHEQETELVYELAGTLGIETEGAIAHVPTGQSAVLPPGRPHRLFNDTAETNHIFLLCAPAIFDRYVAAAGAEVPPGTPPAPMTDAERQRLIELAPTYGVRMLPSTAPENAVAAPPQAATDPAPAGVNVLGRIGTGDESLVLLRTTLQAHATTPPRDHADSTALFVLNGDLTLTHGDTPPTQLAAHQADHIAPGTSYKLTNQGTAPATLLVVTTARAAAAFAA